MFEVNVLHGQTESRTYCQFVFERMFYVQRRKDNPLENRKIYLTFTQTQTQTYTRIRGKFLQK